MIQVRLRLCSVRGTKFLVPTNVNRMDTAKWKGWNVRFKADTSLNKYFSDAKYGNDFQASFDAAVSYANKVRPVPQSKCNTDPNASIHYRVVKRRASQGEHHYIEVTLPTLRTAPKRFYIGTSNTVTEAKKRKAKTLARAFRKHAVKEHALKVQRLHQQPPILV